ncbi:helix-turn-helix domain-containing protein [Agrobacterium sp. NPDC090283]|uniref:helix-turn-helix domain-containing protein n=1 Tax=Agrobacterium sp. NPDC090283 TaxID=3363920 RepID=UPI00383AC5F6
MSTTDRNRPNPIDIHVGSRIRLRRTLIGMSQERLGKNLGITFQQIQKYERGTNRVGASRLQNIAAILDVHVSFFFEGAPDNDTSRTSSPNDFQTFLSSPEGFQLNREFVKIADPKVRQRIIQMVKAAATDGDERQHDS